MPSGKNLIRKKNLIRRGNAGERRARAPVTMWERNAPCVRPDAMLPLPSRMDFIWVMSGPLVAMVGGHSARAGGFGSKQKRVVND